MPSLEKDYLGVKARLFRRFQNNFCVFLKVVQELCCLEPFQLGQQFWLYFFIRRKGNLTFFFKKHHVVTELAFERNREKFARLKSEDRFGETRDQYITNIRKGNLSAVLRGTLVQRSLFSERTKIGTYLERLNNFSSFFRCLYQDMSKFDFVWIVAREK